MAGESWIVGHGILVPTMSSSRDIVDHHVTVLASSQRVKGARS
jgi:hypothetical protein